MPLPNVQPGLKTLHLKISVSLILIVALAYGIHPGKVLPQFFDFTVTTIDLKNVFRAIMGLYISMVIVWIAGIINPRLWLTATITNIAFMTGLAAGRLFSLFADGIPSISFSIGHIAEMLLAIWGVINLKKYGGIVE